jgi:hypothetical protein
MVHKTTMSLRGDDLVVVAVSEDQSKGFFSRGSDVFHSGCSQGQRTFSISQATADAAVSRPILSDLHRVVLSHGIRDRRINRAG